MPRWAGIGKKDAVSSQAREYAACYRNGGTAGARRS
jgi:hypothetical protein